MRKIIYVSFICCFIALFSVKNANAQEENFVDSSQDTQTVETYGNQEDEEQITDSEESSESTQEEPQTSYDEEDEDSYDQDEEEDYQGDEEDY